MTRWFVHHGTEYYPSAEIVEAETPDDARAIVIASNGPGATFVVPIEAGYAIDDEGAAYFEQIETDGQHSMGEWERKTARVAGRLDVAPTRPGAP